MIRTLAAPLVVGDALVAAARGTITTDRDDPLRLKDRGEQTLRSRSEWVRIWTRLSS